ncbi:LytS/YhcK type 5TM receptor domain-containing protein [Gynuella sp.]|uniref:LytS/YhcK type 5TM receptor domain-containing protein n=1 Tax=Gynuella sp. TaxID=2969146 RepID=UPI003D0F9FA8
MSFDWRLLLSLAQQMSIFLVIAYLFSRTPVFAPMTNLSLRLPHKILIYLIFSGFCILGTYFGQPVNDAIANTRAVGAVLGGLFGGPVIGFLVGLTGGIHRYTLGGFTDLACAISTTWEGLLAGLVNFFILKYRRTPDALYSPILAAIVTFCAEACQMLIILLVAKPFTEAVHLVSLIATPMLVANSIGAGLFMAMIRDRKSIYEKYSVTYSAKALQLASRMMGIFRHGFDREHASDVAKIILEETGVSAVALTDREEVIAFVGMGEDHHLPGKPISSKVTLHAIEHNQVMFVDGIDVPYKCSRQKNCPLGSTLVIPLRSDNEVIGTVKLYESKRRLFLNINRTLGEGIAHILEEQLLNSRYQQQKQLLIESELKLVRAQINPHFLFNALNTITAVIRKDATKARELVGDLAIFLRTNLKRTEDISTLAQELEHTRSYLHVEQTRFSDQLIISQDIDATFEQFRLPSFTIQPLVENAIKHGTSQSLETGELKLYSTIREDQPYLAIEDNAGLYPNEDPLQSNKPEHQGLGLHIVNTRLKNLLGSHKGLRVESEPHHYTRVLVPLQNE